MTYRRLLYRLEHADLDAVTIDVASQFGFTTRSTLANIVR